MRPFALLLCVGLLGTGCPSESLVPTTNVRDYRVTFSSAEASSSCSDAIVGEANGWAESVAIYRIHFPEGEEGLRIDMWARTEAQTEDEFSYFASGLLEGSLETGTFSYAGGPYTESRDGTRVEYEVEGEARASFGDLWDRGEERYVITDSADSSAYTPGCTFTLNYEGRALAEQNDAE